MGSRVRIKILTFVLWLKIFDHMGVEGQMLFAKDRVVERICANGPFPQTVDTTQVVAAQFPPLKYNITGNTTFFAVNQETGLISILSSGTASNVNNFTFRKIATDRNGHNAVMTIRLTLIEPTVAIKLCPKMQEFDSREIAPVGEEIGQLNCGNYVPNMFDKDKTIISVSGGYVPFNVTSLGVVVVASPLQFRNSIDDIIIFNVTIRKPLNNTNSNDCKVVQTRLVLRITVRKADCPTGWTYRARSNVLLDFPPLMAIIPATVEHCRETCSTLNTTPCNSFAYDLVMKSCDLFNETDISLPGLVHRKLGTFMYRKCCQTGTFPKYALRQLKKKIETFQEFTTNLSKRILQDLLKITMETNMTNQERLVTIDVMETVISNTSFTNSSNNMTVKYLKVVCHLVDVFIDKQKTIFSDQQQMELLKLIKLFDALLESLISAENTEMNDISVKSVYVHIMKTHRNEFDHPMQEFELVAGGNVSRVSFPNYFNTSFSGSGKMLFVTGALTLHEKALTNGSSVVKDNAIHSNVTLAGHMVSVNVRTYNSVFPALIQLDVFTSKIPGDRTCVYLDLDGIRPVWRDTGCWVVAYNNSHARCHCNHLTNFAVLMQVRQFQVSKIHTASLEVVTVIGCCFSIASLSTTILILLWLRLHTDRYVLLMNLSAALVMAQVVFLTGIDAVKSKSVCRFVAILLHYLYLGVFTLMLAEGIYLYQKLHRAFSTDTSITMFLLLGWGSPFIVLSLSLITNIDGYGTEEHCWLATDGAIWAFVGPAITVISINTTILVSILHTFLSIKIVAKKSDTEKFKASVKVTAVLLPLLGITWMFGVIAVNNSTVIFQYVFALLNSLQGFFIFLFHIVLNDEVRSSYRLQRSRVSTVSDAVSTL